MERSEKTNRIFPIELKIIENTWKERIPNMRDTANEKMKTYIEKNIELKRTLLTPFWKVCKAVQKNIYQSISTRNPKFWSVPFSVPIPKISPSTFWFKKIENIESLTALWTGRTYFKAIPQLMWEKLKNASSRPIYNQKELFLTPFRQVHKAVQELYLSIPAWSLHFL